MEEIRNASATRLTPASRIQTATSERPSQRDRAVSDLSQASYSTLPRTARLHRPSWNSQEFVGTRWEGRARTISNTTVSTFESPDQSPNRLKNSASPRLNLQVAGEGTTNRRPSPLRNRTCRSNTATSPTPYAHGDEITHVRRPESRPSVPSRSSSRAPLEGRVSEEYVPPIQRKSSIGQVKEDEEAKQGESPRDS